MKTNKTFYGLPSEVRFCRKTLMSNQRPSSAIEFKHNLKSKKKGFYINKDGVSETWKFSRKKNKINFKKREEALLKLLDKHRGKHGKYDCIVPGSGGKDSCYASHILKFKYGMNPLTVTWPPILYTDYGKENFNNWIKSGNLKNVSAKRDKETMKILTKFSILNLFHPFQTFILGQKIFPIKIALKYNIPLVFYGENEAERGNQVKDNLKSIRDRSYHTLKNKNEIYLGGVKYKNLITKYQIEEKNLKIFLPPDEKLFKNKKIEIHYLGYFLKWIPQETYYFAVKNCNFRPRPFRTSGTYSKYNSIDDKIDDLHYYTTYIKFGIGRASYDAFQELLNDHLNIYEARKLIAKYDGEFPNVYFNDIMKYLNIDPEFFKGKLTDRFRPPHLWKKIKNKWYLRHNCNFTGVDD